jgi:hypothetical protein
MSLIAGEPLIYERANGVIYAKYRDKPEITRWIVGWDQTAGPKFNVHEWRDILDLAEENPTLMKQIDKVINLYYILKKEKQ